MSIWRTNLCIPAGAPTRFSVDSERWGSSACLDETDRIALEEFFAEREEGKYRAGYAGSPGAGYAFFDGIKRVTSFSLEERGLTGSITSGLGNLSNLKWLLLRNNELSGSIPSTLGNLSNLEHLLLGNNELSGSIPSTLGNLSNLELLMLHQNQLSGPIPPSLGNLSNLEQLMLHQNQLSGPIPPSLGNLSNLEHLWLQENQLSGPIPPSLGNLSNLERLHLQENQLSGPIPPSLGNLSNLEHLQLQQNQLSGSIPPELANLTRVWNLELWGNQLSGAIPSTMWNFKVLSLGHNQLEGPFPLPQGMKPGELPLTSLDVRGNDVCFPDDPVTIEVLTTDNPDISGGQFCGARRDRTALMALYNATGGPSWSGSHGWSEDPKDLDDHRWEGVAWNEVSIQFRSFGLQVTALSLPNNKLSGTLPSELGNMVNLETLVLRDNDLVGPLPRGMIQLSKLKRLDISGTNLCVPADTAFREWLAAIIDFKGTVCGVDGIGENITLTVSPTRRKESDGPIEVLVTATLTGTPRNFDVDVSIAVAGEVALEGTDFESVTAFSVTIPSGVKSGSKVFTLRPIDDNLEERDETLTVRGTATLGGEQRVAEALLTLVDDDKPSTSVSLTLDESVVSESVPLTTVTVTAAFDSKPRTEDTAVTVAVEGSGVEAVVDFTPIPSFVITIPAGSVSGTGTFDLRPENDTIDERNERLTVSGTTTVSTLLQVNGAKLTLQDDDPGDYDSGTYFIRTVAGNTAVADGILAMNATLNTPSDVAVDNLGNVYVADTENDRVRKIDTSGMISTVAGTGNWGYGGDGGPAAEAALNRPWSVATDAAGNLYVADTSNHRVRKVDAAGTITTVAGVGEWGYGGDGGPALEALLGLPRGIAVDAVGNLYIADSGNNRIRKVDAAGTITTVAGTGDWEHGGDGGRATEAGLPFPIGVAADSVGNILVVAGPRVRRIDTAGIITTFAGTGEQGDGGDGGLATEARFTYPSGVTADATGNVYVSDSNGRRVRKIDASGIITTLAGTGRWGDGEDGGLATDTPLKGPSGVALDTAGNVFISDQWDNRVRKIDTMGIISTLAGTGDWKDAEDTIGSNSAKFRFPRGAALDASGNLYFLDDARVWKLDMSGSVTAFAGTLEGYGGDGGPAIEARLYGPSGVAMDSFGNVYVTEQWQDRVRKIDTTGTISTLAGTGDWGNGGDGGPAIEAQLAQPTSVAVDPFGNVYVADQGNHRVRMIDSDGNIHTLAGTGESGYGGDDGPADQAQLSDPTNVAADAAGNVYVAEGYSRVRKIDPNGIITKFVRITGGGVQALAVDDFGNVFVGGGYQILRISGVDGGAEVIAGTGEPGFGGDGGPSVNARLSVWGIAVDADGKVWFTDGYSRRVRVLERSVPSQ